MWIKVNDSPTYFIFSGGFKMVVAQQLAWSTFLPFSSPPMSNGGRRKRHQCSHLFGPQSSFGVACIFKRILQKSTRWVGVYIFRKEMFHTFLVYLLWSTWRTQDIITCLKHVCTTNLPQPRKTMCFAASPAVRRWRSNHSITWGAKGALPVALAVTAREREADFKKGKREGGRLRRNCNAAVQWPRFARWRQQLHEIKKGILLRFLPVYSDSLSIFAQPRPHLHLNAVQLTGAPPTPSVFSPSTECTRPAHR